MPRPTAIASILAFAAHRLDVEGVVPYPVRRSLHDTSRACHGEPIARVFSGLLALDCAKRSFGVWLDNGGWSELGEFERVGRDCLSPAPSLGGRTIGSPKPKPR